jgi:hypothetical protein
MERLEKKMEAEKKKRIEMNKSLQNFCSEQIEKMSMNFENLLEQRALQVNQRLDILQKEIFILQEFFQQEKKNIPQIIEEKKNEFTNKLDIFIKVFEEERKRRTIQEEFFLKKMNQHEHSTTENFENERVSLF